VFEGILNHRLRENSPEPEPGEYQCACCGQVFSKPQGWTDEDAKREAETVFGSYDPSFAEVCDVCYKEMNPA
jgi:hypothetical protein